MSKAVKEAVSDSTNKLDEINAAFSKDMGLVEAVESILGKVKFKSAKEVLNASKKLEQLFSQKGLGSEVVDEFLKRVGIDSAEFRTSEAVRQISNKTTSANVKGLSLGEIIQSVTSAVLTPKAVRDIAIFTGLSRKAAKEVFEKIAPAARGTLLQILTNRE